MTWRRENSCPYWDLNSNLSVVQPVASHYTDCTILALSDTHGNPLCPLQLFYFHLWPIYWLVLVSVIYILRMCCNVNSTAYKSVALHVKLFKHLYDLSKAFWSLCLDCVITDRSFILSHGIPLIKYCTLVVDTYKPWSKIKYFLQSYCNRYEQQLLKCSCKVKHSAILRSLQRITHPKW
jgi:hypothetical protein